MDPRTISDKLFHSPNALDVIDAVTTAGAPLTITDIATMSKVSRSAAGRAVARLVGIELLERTETLYTPAAWVPEEFWVGCRALRGSDAMARSKR